LERLPIKLKLPWGRWKGEKIYTWFNLGIGFPIGNGKINSLFFGAFGGLFNFPLIWVGGQFWIVAGDQGVWGPRFKKTPIGPNKPKDYRVILASKAQGDSGEAQGFYYYIPGRGEGPPI